MSNQVYVKVDSEVFNKKFRKDNCRCDVEKQRSELLVSCFNTELEYMTLKFQMLALANAIKESKLYDITQEVDSLEEGDTLVFSSMYSDGRYAASAPDTTDDAINRCIEEFYLFAKVIPTPDYYDDNERWNEKKSQILQEIDTFISFIEDMVIYDIIETFNTEENG